MQKEAEKSRENPHFQAGIFHTLSRTTTVEHWDRTQIAAMRSKCLFTAHLGHLHKYIAHRHSPAYFVNDERCLFIQRRRKQLESVGARLIKNHAKKKKWSTATLQKKSHTHPSPHPNLFRGLCYICLPSILILQSRGQTYIKDLVRHLQNQLGNTYDIHLYSHHLRVYIIMHYQTSNIFFSSSYNKKIKHWLQK